MTDAGILNISDYNLSRFSHEGLGGTRKYVAQPKNANQPKLLIKHGGEFSPGCSNFMYARLGKEMGVTIPQCYIMCFTPKDRHLFDTSCVIGMEFIEGLQPTNLAIIKGNKKLETDLINCFVLAGLFTQFDDIMQTAYVPKVGVYPLDFDESFDMDNGLFNCILRDDDYSEDAVVMKLRRRYQTELTRCLDIANKVAAKTLDLRIEEVRSIALDLLQRFTAISEEKVEKIGDSLSEMFTSLLAIYYEEYVSILHKKTEEYIAKTV